MSRGHVTRFGYRRVLVPGTRKWKMEHVPGWETAHGPVPPGMELHHVNADKLDNRLENLRVVTRLEHKRLHGGCERREGVWWRPCRRCGVMQPVTNYYTKPDGIFSICRACAIRLAVFSKQRRRERRRAQEAAAAETAECAA